MNKNNIFFLPVIIVMLILSSCSAKNSQEKIQPLTTEERIIGLSKIWKEAQYNFPFWMNLKDLDWDAAYQKALTNILNEKDVRLYYLELSKFLTLLRDGHTGITVFPESIMKNAGRFPVMFMYINGKHYIMRCDENLDIDLYTEVIKINGKDVNEYFTENIYPYFWHEKLDSAYYQVNYILPLIEYGKELEITTDKQTFRINATTKEIKWKDTVTVSIDEPLNRIFESEGLKVELTNDIVL